MSVNYVAILVSAVLAMVVGAVWYGPLFGKMWMKLSGMKMEDAKKTDMSKAYGLTFVGWLLVAFVLAHFVQYTDSMTFADGAMTAFWAWLGFALPTAIGTTVFEGKPMQLLLLNKCHDLTAMLLMGGILTVWT